VSSDVFLPFKTHDLHIFCGNHVATMYNNVSRSSARFVYPTKTSGTKVGGILPKQLLYHIKEI